ncbi:MAG: TolC family protein, partial [Bdellovibrionales bacterium]|nr:TolC family protein [Bdellovibrionales bacterium]
MDIRQRNYQFYILIFMALGTLAACSASRRDIPREIPQQEGASEGPQRQEEIAREVRSELIVSGEVESLDSSSSPSTLGEDASLDDYILFALKASSELKSAFASYRAALQKSPQVSTLPDPTLNYGYFIKEVETRVGPQEQKVGLMQPIPWFGKLSLKGEIADSEAKAAFYAFLAKKNKLVTDVTDAYFELAYLKSASEITDANFELLKRWEQVVAQKYRSQTGTQADLIKVQVELGKLEDKLKELKDLEAPLLARFNALLNRESYLAVSVSQDALAVFSDELRKRFTKLDQ